MPLGAYTVRSCPQECVFCERACKHVWRHGRRVLWLARGNASSGPTMGRAPRFLCNLKLPSQSNQTRLITRDICRWISWISPSSPLAFLPSLPPLLLLLLLPLLYHLLLLLLLTSFSLISLFCRPSHYFYCTRISRNVLNLKGELTQITSTVDYY